MPMFSAFLNVFHKLRKSEFVKDVFILGGGTAASQAVSVIAIPVLTRLYSPDDFGILAVYMSLVSTIAPMSSFYYVFSIVLPKENDAAANILLLCIVLVTCVSVFTLAVVVLFNKTIAAFLKTPRIAFWLYIVPFSLALGGWYQVFNYWCTRAKQFGSISIALFLQACTTVTIQVVVAVLYSPTLKGLIGGFVAGQFVAATLLGTRTIRQDGKFILDSASISKMKKEARCYRKYPIYDSWPSFCASFMHSLPVFFLTKYYGSEITGFYSLARRIFNMSSTLIARSISQVLFRDLAEKKVVKGEINRDVERAFRWLGIIAALLFLGMIGSSFLFGFVFGHEWTVAGKFLRILAPAFALMFMVSPMSIVLGVVNRQELSAAWQVGALIVTAATLRTSLYFGSAESMIYTLSINNVVLYLIYAYLILHACRCNVSGVFGIHGKSREE